MTEVTRQRIEHLKLQGFTPEQAARMQKVSIWEVLKVYNQDKVFNDGNESEYAIAAGNK